MERERSRELTLLCRRYVRVEDDAAARAPTLPPALSIRVMDERTRTPKRAPARRRKRETSEHHPARRAEERHPLPVEQPAPQTQGGGGSFGGGPVDDDDGGRKPERPNDDSKRLLVVLGILAIGAGVLSARLLSKQVPRRPSALRR